MSLTCSSCGLEHDLDAAPDTGECLACSGLLVEDDGAVPDRVEMMREAMGATVQTLARQRGITVEEMWTRLGLQPGLDGGGDGDGGPKA